MVDQNAEIHEIKQKLETLTDGGWFKRNLAVILSGTGYAVIVVVGYAMLLAQVDTNTEDIKTKADKELVNIELNNIRQHHESDQSNVVKSMDKMDKKMDDQIKLLQQISRELPRIK